MNTIEIIDHFIEKIQQRNADALIALMAEDVIFYDIPKDTHHGISAVHQLFENFFTHAASIDWEIIHKIIQDNVAVIERINHVNIQGKNISLPMVTVIEVVAGKIKVIRDYFDLKSFTDQLAA